MFIEWNSPIGLAPEERNVAGQTWDSYGAHVLFATPAIDIRPLRPRDLLFELWRQGTRRFSN